MQRRIGDDTDGTTRMALLTLRTTLMDGTLGMALLSLGIAVERAVARDRNMALLSLGRSAEVAHKMAQLSLVREDAGKRRGMALLSLEIQSRSDASWSLSHGNKTAVHLRQHDPTPHRKGMLSAGFAPSGASHRLRTRSSRRRPRLLVSTPRRSRLFILPRTTG